MHSHSMRKITHTPAFVSQFMKNDYTIKLFHVDLLFSAARLGIDGASFSIVQ